MEHSQIDKYLEKQALDAEHIKLLDTTISECKNILSYFYCFLRTYLKKNLQKLRFDTFYHNPKINLFPTSIFFLLLVFLRKKN